MTGSNFSNLLAHYNRIVATNLLGSHLPVVKGANVPVSVSVDSTEEATAAAHECWKKKITCDLGISKITQFEIQLHRSCIAFMSNGELINYDGL
jgi:hypothetical protein